MPGSRRTRAPAAISALLVATTILAGCGEKDEPDLTAATTTTATGKAADIAGDWTGTLTQKGLKPFHVAVRIEPTGSGLVAYTGIKCGGTWKLSDVLLSNPAQYIYEETIDRGAGGECKGQGKVTLLPQGENLGYTFRDGDITSGGTLSRTTAAGLAPTFQQAGLRPPA